MAKSLLDHAHDYVEKSVGGASFKDLWAYVVNEARLSQEQADAKVARFYTNLLLDGRFVTLGDNIWDLRARNTFDKADRGDPEILYAETEEHAQESSTTEEENETEESEDFDEEDSDEEKESEEENY